MKKMCFLVLSFTPLFNNSTESNIAPNFEKLEDPPMGYSGLCYHVIFYRHICQDIPGKVAQSVTCLATDASLTADPGVPSSIPAWFHTFVEINYEKFSTVILLSSTESFKKDCCQLQEKVCA